MKEFDEILELLKRLHGPGGCPWDQSQNFWTLQPYLLEEAHEVIDAVDEKDDLRTLSELGDLLYTILFFAKIAEKERRFGIQAILQSIKEKVVRRHPHVFGGKEISIEEVIKRWEELKMEEKEHEKRESLLDGIPKQMHSLLRAQKMLGKMRRAHPALFSLEKDAKALTEQEIGKGLIEMILKADAEGVDVEGALRRALAPFEEAFRLWEKEKH
ncbi:MAG: hypothetical protein A2Y28_01875 [Chlamydiae bacterium GWC2_50_10]|nr:MAG: hypothetical protein A2Z85_00015 [Chlamydiae bacterium GWA2_50_15]OGN53635.1 MAG: hypothetical protein A2Y28_01875 [Chlamydiae bacterium GWC2_50_10]OGN54555.1 MAG: hypothetical protein A2098_00215 [Chlamydiae bacterium GWF2_49_8]OGN67797.1 MAG: hypothetical protein A3I15_03635 [Chlamydiae bacterium RIFCSPLOWO2_02_FULL_49_12]OGN70312.1 MAG: hypothetical protein A3G30_01870 [Chlamydiae bacterium RIFCSPLOWO2_12_FULL_49_12]HAZ15594.1 hypothetical protein [Parachlamydiales bacterium]